MGELLDNYDLWKRHDDEREAELKKRPVCANCTNHIQHDHFYMIEGKPVCPDCMESDYRIEVEDYVE